jgi:release factor glutamine methyltransferase
VSDLRTEAIRRLADAGVDSPRLDVRLMWDHAQRNPTIFEEYVARRCAREPLAYIIGRKEFWSLNFEVGPGVLVPRPETETIIEQAMELLPDSSAPYRVLDLGTGSGCLLAAFLKEFPNARGLGVDCSEKTCRVASGNLTQLGLADRGEVRCGNWGENVSGAWDAILSNPPYIRSDQLSGLAPEVIRHEPVEALDGGPDGLQAIRALAQVIARLCPRLALVEIGAGQATEAAAAMADRGLVVVRIALDLAGIPRVLVVRPA